MIIKLCGELHHLTVVRGVKCVSYKGSRVSD